MCETASGTGRMKRIQFSLSLFSLAAKHFG
jgi:hypothetical protein